VYVQPFDFLYGQYSSNEYMRRLFKLEKAFGIC